jgi:PadR family transcriptional regulator PadR
MLTNVNMSKKSANQRELVFLATLLHGERYGVEIRDDVEKRTGKPVPLGSLYVTLDRMEAAGFVTSRFGESSHDRGGNRRRYFKLTGQGIHAYNEAAQAIGLPSVKGVANGGAF